MDKEIRLEQKNKELIGKIKFNEKSRRKMQQSLMKQINDLEQQCKKQKEINQKAIEYIKEKQKIQYKFALSHIECDDLLQILEELEQGSDSDE